MGKVIATKSELRQGLVKVPLDTRTTIVVVPEALQCEIVGKLFDRGKTFLWIDRAIEGLRYAHRLAVHAASGKDVLIVAHTNPSRDLSKSEKLSRDRAAAVAAWFEGDVDTWLDNYKDSIPQRERWGAREDRCMLRALGDFDAVNEEERPEKADERYDPLVCGFQRSRRLTDDGIAGPVTRKQLIQEYFALAKVTDDLKPVPPRKAAALANVNLAQHGAGPHFSVANANTKRKETLAEAKGSTTSAAANSAPSQQAPSKGDSSNDSPSKGDNDASTNLPEVHARLDFFFFFNKEGMSPSPGNADGEEFLEWVALSAEDHKHFRFTAPPPKEAKTLSFKGGHFSTGSAVLLPEGEVLNHDDDRTKSTLNASTGALAMALRFNEERPGHKLLIGGHTDSVGNDEDNDILSMQRARLVHALLTGDRDTFVDIADRKRTASDWKKILKWASATFPSIEPLYAEEKLEEEGGEPPKASGQDGELGTGFSGCDPGDIDNADGDESAVKAFQNSYNDNYKLVGGTDTIQVDGIVGKQTWGAIFDLYQYDIARHLGEDFKGVQSLRDLVQFLPTKHPFVGFGEHHPTDGSFGDDVASEANRRVEVLFFEQGNEPDIGVLDEAPEQTEAYDGDEFSNTTIGERPGGAKAHFTFRLYLNRPSDAQLGAAYQLVHSSGTYTETLEEASSEVFQEGVRLLAFEGVPSGGTLTLKRTGPSGTLTVFDEVPPAQLLGDREAATPREQVSLTREPDTDFLNYPLEESLS